MNRLIILATVLLVVFGLTLSIYANNSATDDIYITLDVDPHVEINFAKDSIELKIDSINSNKSEKLDFEIAANTGVVVDVDSKGFGNILDEYVEYSIDSTDYGVSFAAGNEFSFNIKQNGHYDLEFKAQYNSDFAKDNWWEVKEGSDVVIFTVSAEN